MNNLTSRISIQTIIVLFFTNNFVSVANSLDFPLNLTKNEYLHGDKAGFIKLADFI